MWRWELLYTRQVYYSQNSLIQTPKGQNQVFALQRSPYYRGRECMIFGFSGTKRTVRNKRCPYYRGVRKERCPYYRGVRNKRCPYYRGVRIIEVSVRRGYTVLTFHSLHLSHFVFITKIISRLLNYVPLNEMGIELQKTKKILNIPKIWIFSLSSRSVPVF